MKKIQPQYRILAVMLIMIAALATIQGHDKPVDASEIKSSTITPVQSKRAVNGAINAYIKAIFGSCKIDASRYLQKVNSSYATGLVTHNYIADTKIYDSSYVGLFQINDTIPEAQGYPLSELLDYKTNTDIAYALFVKNGNTFGSDSCLDY